MSTPQENKHGSSGQHAAEDTKSTFKKALEPLEAGRQNVNAYADTMISGQSHVDPDHGYRTHTIKQHDSTGVHPDAKEAGDVMAKAAGAAGGKIKGFIDKQRHHK